MTSKSLPLSPYPPSVESLDDPTMSPPVPVEQGIGVIHESIASSIALNRKIANSAILATELYCDG